MDPKTLLLLALLVALLIITRQTPKSEGWNPFSWIKSTAKNTWSRVSGRPVGTSRGRAQVYENSHFGGASGGFGPEWPVPDLGWWKKRISSIHVPKGYVLKFWSEPNYQGFYGAFSAGDYKDVGSWWNDQISSLHLVKAQDV